MLNPLLHPYSSSAPTSPRCTRSALAQRRIRNRTIVVAASGLIPVAAESVVMRAIPKKYREMSPSRRRLSRVVKCRTVDFTEFPEGMRDYYNHLNGKRVLREIQSQPGSPVIPRIEVHDFGSEVKLTGKRLPPRWWPCMQTLWPLPLLNDIYLDTLERRLLLLRPRRLSNYQRPLMKPLD
jgi:hypothetical protein